jgi:hypothetical protein
MVVRDVVESTGMAPDEVLEQFGEALVPGACTEATRSA